MEGHVLIVDDNINNLRIAVDILIHEKLKITTAKSGTDAIKALERNHIDLVLLDVNMPEMDGFETLGAIRSNTAFKHIPVLFVTSHTDEDFIERGFQCGCVDYITKPFRPSEFISRVKTQLKLAKYQNNLQKAVDEKTDLLQATIEQLQASEKAKDTFLSVMSHELRTPLNGILGMTALLKIPEMKAKSSEIIEDLEASTKRLNRLITDILDFSMIDTPTTSAFASEITLDEFILKIRYLSLAREEYDIDFSVNISHGVPEEFKIDCKSAIKIIECILDNAYKFTNKGKVSVSLDYEDTDKDSGLIKVNIKDDGPGIEEHNFSKIFDKFFQLDSGLTRCYEGSGIGLAIAQKLINVMGGAIEVNSKLGEGSTFQIQLPIITESNKPESVKLKHISDANLLIVEDVPTNQALLSRLLSLKNPNIFIACDYKECFEIMQNEDIDLIFMDYMLPELDGTEITQKIRENEELSNKLPVIAVTAKADDCSRNKCLTSGMNSFVTKPYFASEIFSCLSHYFEMD